jgi:hypothetical protein
MPLDRNHPSTKAKQGERSISIDDLKRHFTFDLDNGEIYGPRGGRADKLQHFRGVKYTNGPPRYRQIQIRFKGVDYRIAAHRAIWAVANNRWPQEGCVIDHLNQNTQDNCIGNLEEVTAEENRARVRRPANSPHATKQKVVVPVIGKQVSPDKIHEGLIGALLKSFANNDPTPLRAFVNAQNVATQRKIRLFVEEFTIYELRKDPGKPAMYRKKKGERGKQPIRPEGYYRALPRWDEWATQQMAIEQKNAIARLSSDTAFKPQTKLLKRGKTT